MSEKQSEVGNRRNGKTSKLLKTGTESFELETPRDRAGTFEPQIVKKRQTVLNESLDNKILSLYALGMSYEGIQGHLAEMYGLEVSAAKISLISDKLMPVITEWRNRPLESVYSIVFLDAMHFKVRVEGKVISKAFYSVLGINNSGRKEILGLYLSENEGARFWLGVLNDLRARGIERCQARTGRAQRNHIFIAISAWLQKYQQRLKHKFSFYQQDWLIIKTSIAKNLKLILQQP